MMRAIITILILFLHSNFAFAGSSSCKVTIGDFDWDSANIRTAIIKKFIQIFSRHWLVLFR